MSEEAKTYVFGNDSNSLIPALMNNNGFGGNMGAWWIIIILAVLWGRNGFGNGQDLSSLYSTLTSGQNSNLVMDAIAGNSTAISQLAQTIGTSTADLQQAICSVNQSIMQVGNQVGMSGMQVQNAVTAGNAALATQIQQAACSINNGITTQGYENRIANSDQTAILGSKIDAQTTLLTSEFCALKEREMQARIDQLIEANSGLKSQIDNANQTAAITNYVNGLIAPLTTTVNEIKAATPSTVSVPYPQLTAIPQSYLYGYNGSIWS